MDILIEYFLYFLIVIFLFIVILHPSIFIAIFFLIIVFFFLAFFFIINGFEFIGFLYLIIYVGAVAVLFLFMVMLFDKSEYLYFLKSKIFFDYFLFFIFSNSLLLCIFFSNCIIYYDCNLSLFDYFLVQYYINDFHEIFFINSYNNLEMIGILLYIYFYISIFGASLILLIGMIGAILLTQSIPISNLFVNKQNSIVQLFRYKN